MVQLNYRYLIEPATIADISENFSCDELPLNINVWQKYLTGFLFSHSSMKLGGESNKFPTLIFLNHPNAPRHVGTTGTLRLPYFCL